MLAYMLQKQSSGNNHTFTSCYKKALKYMKQNNGVSWINNYETSTKWNRTFCLDEIFPHPNINFPKNI